MLRKVSWVSVLAAIVASLAVHGLGLGMWFWAALGFDAHTPPTQTVSVAILAPASPVAAPIVPPLKVAAARSVRPTRGLRSKSAPKADVPPHRASEATLAMSDTTLLHVVEGEGEPHVLNESLAQPAAPGTATMEVQTPMVEGTEPIAPWVAAGSHARRFRVYWGDFTQGVSVARLDYRFERQGEHYLIRTVARAEGLIALVYSGLLTQSSIGRVGVAGLEPMQYTEQRGQRPERRIDFDREADLLRPTGAAPVPLPAGTQDRLSVFYQLSAWVRAEPGRFAPGQVQSVSVASMRTVESERFEVLGEAMLATPRGLLRTLHVRRPAPPGTDDPEIQVWLGYDFEMLPVRLRAEDARGRVLDQVLDDPGNGD